MKVFRTSIYVDGFNLYYGCLQDTPYKWLDLKALFERILGPRNEITCIKYFTAKVKHHYGKPERLKRQEIYIEAIEWYIPELKTYYGKLHRRKHRFPNGHPPPEHLKFV